MLRVEKKKQPVSVQFSLTAHYVYWEIIFSSGNAALLWKANSITFPLIFSSPTPKALFSSYTDELYAVTVLDVISNAIAKIFLITIEKSVRDFSNSWLLFPAEF